MSAQETHWIDGIISEVLPHGLDGGVVPGDLPSVSTLTGRSLDLLRNAAGQPQGRLNDWLFGPHRTMQASMPDAMLLVGMGLMRRQSGRLSGQADYFITDAGRGVLAEAERPRRPIMLARRLVAEQAPDTPLTMRDFSRSTYVTVASGRQNGMVFTWLGEQGHSPDDRKTLAEWDRIMSGWPASWESTVKHAQVSAVEEGVYRERRARRLKASIPTLHDRVKWVLSSTTKPGLTADLVGAALEMSTAEAAEVLAALVQKGEVEELAAGVFRLKATVKRRREAVDLANVPVGSLIVVSVSAGDEIEMIFDGLNPDGTIKAHLMADLVGGTHTVMPDRVLSVHPLAAACGRPARESRRVRMREAQGMVKAGTKSWFVAGEEEVAEFIQDTLVTVEGPDASGWYTTVGKVPGFPPGRRVFLRREHFQTLTARRRPAREAGWEWQSDMERWVAKQGNLKANVFVDWGSWAVEILDMSRGGWELAIKKEIYSVEDAKRWAEGQLATLASVRPKLARRGPARGAKRAREAEQVNFATFVNQSPLSVEEADEFWDWLEFQKGIENINDTRSLEDWSDLLTEFDNSEYGGGFYGARRLVRKRANPKGDQRHGK